VKLIGRCGIERSGRPATLLVAALGCSLVLVLAGCSRSAGTGGALAKESSAAGSAYTLMQMNLCLSGLSECYRKVAYPAVVQEAIARIRAAHPDAVTLSETCRSDVARIARRTGYHVRFSRVVYMGSLLPCVDPVGRGLFGDAVLVKAAIEGTDNQDFQAQRGLERRRWLCVSTRADVDVCTTHLNVRSGADTPANDGQCAELASILARRAVARPVIFGGDVNRRSSCAPDGFWTRTDSAARQAPGLQQVYGSGALRSPSAEVVPARHTDHDVLLVHAHPPAR